MSRIGKKVIIVPKEVQVKLQNGVISIKGPLGELKRAVPDGIVVELALPEIHFKRNDEGKETRSKHGLIRALIANMVLGVTQGFSRKIEINGVGYRAEVSGSKIVMNVGLSHQVELVLPVGVSAKTEKIKSTVQASQDAVLLTLSGTDSEMVGQCAAKLISFRPCEPYKGKGLKYLEQKIKLKPGKAGTN